jgi:hypothetical protein
MAINSDELVQIFATLGVGKLPFTGGPATLLNSVIAQTMPFEKADGATAPATGVMDLTAIYLPVSKIITNINYISSTTAEATGTHLWFALYDDGRGSTTAGQLALLGQTTDQTGAAAFAANTNLGLSLLTPYTTTYTGIYYIGFLCVATTMPTLCGAIRASTASIQLAASAGALLSGTAGSGLTTAAPNPSGAVTISSRTQFAYVS